VSYCDTNAKTELDKKMPSTAMVEADFAAQIGRCSRPNTISTAMASARMLSVDKTAYGADRAYYSPIRRGLWRSVAVRELSITQGGSAAEEAYQQQCRRNDAAW
jgi:hypothetical protein